MNNWCKRTDKKDKEMKVKILKVEVDDVYEK